MFIGSDRVIVLAITRKLICLPEVRYGQVTRGGDILGSEEFIDKGFWHLPDFDPNCCGVGSIFNPLGPWPRSVSSEFS